MAAENKAIELDIHEWSRVLRPCAEPGRKRCQSASISLEPQRRSPIDYQPSIGDCPTSTMIADRMRDIMSTTDEFGFPLTLTQVRRRLVAEFIPHLTDRLKIEEAASRTIRFTSQEVQHIVAVCQTAMPKATKRKVQDGLQYVVDAPTPWCSNSSKRVAWLASLLPSDCTSSRLRSGASSGRSGVGFRSRTVHSTDFTNTSRRRWAGRTPICTVFASGISSTAIRCCCRRIFTKWAMRTPRPQVSTVVSKSDESFRFDYEYDFGDRWKHSVLFEGCVRARKGTRHPTCLEGERACPPEDVGGVRGYQVPHDIEQSRT